MSKFVTRKVDAPSAVKEIQWHPNEALLALSCAGGTVAVCTDEGELLAERISLPQLNDQPTAMAWNPSQRMLLVGWPDGGLSVWADGDKPHEESSVHKSAITCITWHPSGKRVTIGDVEGLISVWRCDKSGKLANACQYQKQDAILGCSFRTTNGAGGRFPFYAALAGGVVLVCDDSGSMCIECCAAESALLSMWYNEEKDTVVLLTVTNTLMSYRPSGMPNRHELFAQIKMVLGADEDISNAVLAWSGQGHVALCSSDSIIRVWDVNRSQTFALTALGTALVAGTKRGKILMWQFVGNDEEETASSTDWESQEPAGVSSAVLHVGWGPGERLFAAIHNDGKSIEIFSETTMKCSMVGTTAAFQVSPTDIVLERFKNPNCVVLQSEIPIKWSKMFANRFVVWNGQQLCLYKVDADALAATKESLISTRSTLAAMHGERNLLLVTEGQVQVCNVNGVSKQSLAFSPAEGEPVLLDISGDYLAVVTSSNHLKAFDFQKREARPYGINRSFEPAKDGSAEVGAITSVRMSPDGSHISFVANEPGTTRPSSAIYVYSLNSGKLYSFDWQTHFAAAHYWDPLYPKLLACEIQPLRRGRREGEEEWRYANMVSILFAPNDGDSDSLGNTASLLHHETIPMPKGSDALLGVAVPHLFFATKGRGSASTVDAKASLLMSVPMRNFTGMENVDAATRDAVIAFSYHFALGSTDEAYKAIKAVQNPNVWNNMAQMMVKARRADMLPALAICLGNMGNARAAMALRNSMSLKEPEARLASVAIHLGMADEAEKIYRSIGRIDLLVRMYQNSGKWDDAIALAAESDRVHLKAIHHACGKYYETIGDIGRAKSEYKEADSHRTEVPRMYAELDMMGEFDKYINDEGKDSKLLQWRGRFAESVGDFDKALSYYEQAKDYFSLVRIYCFQNRREDAKKVVEQTGDKAAAYHLARQYEDEGNEDSTREALRLYGKAGSLNHALRVAMEQELDSEVVNLALQASPHHMLTAAHYLEGRSLNEKAVLLFQKGGNSAKAISLCFQSQLFGPLAQIADTLDAKTDADLIGKCADFFMENEQYSRAVQLYITAGHTAKALDICRAYNVPIMDEMADRMVPPETEDPTRRTRILRAIAKVCDHQNNYGLSTRFYTMAKDTVKAMKVLLKSGDTEKIVFFASVSQQAEIYVMAANYLQTLEWRTSPELMKHIIGFYKKARAMDSLSRFYQSCAQVEIDEYRNYEKALGALREALLYCSKSKSPDKAFNQKMLETKIHLVEQYLQALVDACGEAKSPEDVAVRVGDVFALLVEHFYSTGNHQNAHAVIEQMHARNIDVFFHVQEDLIKHVYESLGLPYEGPQALATPQQQQPQEGEQIEEVPEGVAEEVQEPQEEVGEPQGGSDIEEEIEAQ
eukprot:m51a1_g11109 putative intraflagellar transport protein 140 homolog (1388) ;mRNA; f:71491-76947